MRAKLDGKAGERAALDYLLKKGYRPAGENYRTRYGEIDLIVENGIYLVFCEVKARSGFSFARPLEHVDTKKRRKVVVSAEQWLSEHLTRLQPRFDVIEVFFRNGRAEVKHIENAFE